MTLSRLPGHRSTDVLIVGSGVAGLAAALHLRGRRVTILSKTGFGRGGSSALAQGGVAVALGPDDAPALHAADTVAVGAGLNREERVDLLVREGPRRVLELVELGARFDRQEDGDLARTREAAHSRRRVVHARDATGAEIVRAMGEAARRRPDLQLVEDSFAAELLTSGGRVVGVLALEPRGPVAWSAPAVVLATGGCGRLFLHTTNAPESTADGLVVAARAGAELADLEFVQFHPTALDDGSDPMPLLTEALRGEGAVLVDETGRRFVADFDARAELAPRDVVARALWSHRRAGHRTFLDASALPDLAERFPTVMASCAARGLDPRRQPIPVSPAAHYHMGGVVTDASGRTTLPGLWAAGEVAVTGVHGANRLASNSLLEALVFGARVGEDLEATGLRPVLRRRVSAPVRVEDPAVIAEVRRLAWEEIGLVRTGEGLGRALERLEALERSLPDGVGETRNLVEAARLVGTAALLREESRGAHTRLDHPETRDDFRRSLVLAGPAVRAGRTA